MMHVFLATGLCEVQGMRRCVYAHALPTFADCSRLASLEVLPPSTVLCVARRRQLVLELLQE